MSQSRRINSYNLVTFNLATLADFNAWNLLLSPSAAGRAARAAYQGGDLMCDSLTGATFMLNGSSLSTVPPFFAMGENTVITSCTVAAAQTVKRNTYVKFSGDREVTPITTQGEAAGGIAMNDATNGESVFVMTSGQYLVVHNDNTLAPQSKVTTTSAGETSSVGFEEEYTGIVLADQITIGGTPYDLVTFAVPVTGGGGSGGGSSLDALLFGTGTDGDFTLNAPLTAGGDVYANNLMIIAGGSLNMAGFRLFVKGILDLTNAPANAITNRGDSGAAGGAGATEGTVGGGTAGTAGGTSTVAAGNQSPAPTDATPANGGDGGSGGKGGDSPTALGAAARPGGLAQAAMDVNAWARDLVIGSALLKGGAGGSGGGGGAGNAVTLGGAGGRGGGGGGVLWISAKTIARGLGTTPGAIQAGGGDGQAGVASANAAAGGGGGGNGGGGGWIWLAYGTLTGAVATSPLVANGGSGAAGGAGNTTGTGGDGGNGANGGRITVIDLAANTAAVTLGQLGVSGTPGAVTAGGAGGTGGFCISNL